MSISSDILSKKIIPYFQPIISVDTCDVYSYEVLGRYVDDDGTVKSLGAFFSDPNVSADDALEVDRIVRRGALEQYAKSAQDRCLFINLRLEWILQYADKLGELPTVLWANELGIDTSKLVIEVTEEEFNADNEAITKVIEHYRRRGCRIAVDDYGKQASNIDRLALLAPDILKISMEYVQKCEESFHYRKYLKMLTQFTKRVGIEILYEGIETQKQLDICIDSGGRFYQGFLLAMPQEKMQEPTVDYDVLKSSVSRSILSRQNRAERINGLRRFWDMRIEQYFSKNRFSVFQDDLNEYCSKLFLEISDMAKRIYLCNRRGEQLSYNIEMGDDGVKWVDCRGRNWAWRDYFQEAMIMHGAGVKSHLTNISRDIDTKEKVYTYIYAINTDLFMFIDISRAKELVEDALHGGHLVDE